MALIVGLVVAGIDAEPLAAEHIVGAEQVGCLGVIDRGADFLARELGGRVVRLPVEQQVAEGGRGREARRVPRTPHIAGGAPSGVESSAGRVL